MYLTHSFHIISDVISDHWHNGVTMRALFGFVVCSGTRLQVKRWQVKRFQICEQHFMKIKQIAGRLVRMRGNAGR